MSARQPLNVAQVLLEGVHLIEASAGTGKTHTITSLILRAVVESEIPIEKIAAVTFTNAATAELRERVGLRLQQAQNALRTGMAPATDTVLLRLLEMSDRRRVEQLVDRALRDLDRAAVFTIHGFSQRMLVEHAFESGARYEVELIGDQARVVYDVLVDFWSARVARLSEAEFRLLGGIRFFEDLRQVVREASIAVDAELVELSGQDSIDATLARLERPFFHASELWHSHGSQAREMLNSPALNKNRLRGSSLDADVREWREYFQRGDCTWKLHKDHGRWKQSFIHAAANKGKLPVSHPLFVAIEELSEIHAELEGLLCKRRAALRAELVQFVRTRLKSEHASARTQSFDDLLLELRQALRHPERGAALATAIRSAFPVALIDEFQDTDPIQYEIFRRLFGESARGRALFLIGDPKQSIYSFRGADVHSYLTAVGDASGGIWTLGTSYRASPALISAQNALFARPRQPFGVASITCEPVSAAPEKKDQLVNESGLPLPGLLVRRSVERSNRLVLAQAAREVAFFLRAGHRLHDKPVTPGHLAVLTRTNREAQQVQAELSRLRIPAVMHGDRSVFESPEALELRRILRALAEPSSPRWTRAALATRFLGMDADKLRSLDVDTAELERWTALLKARAEDWVNRGVVQALERLADETGLVARTLSEFDGERRITNYRHLVELLHEAEARSHLGVSGLLRFLDAAIADPMGHAMAAESRQLRLESDSDAVTLTTIHKSKGLEYEVVFLPTVGFWTEMWDSKAYRFKRDTDPRTFLEVRDPAERDGSYELAQSAARQESLRLCYVALTRAKHHVVAFLPDLSGSSRSAAISPLAYYLHERSAREPGGLGCLVAHMKTLTAEMRAADEAALVSSSLRTLAFADCSDDRASYFVREKAAHSLRVLPSPTEVAEGERTSSFSSMTRGHDSKLSRASREGRDVDEAGASPTEGAFDQSALDQSLLDRKSLETAESPVGHAERILLADFPRGAGPGEALHGLLESADFQLDVASRPETVELATRELAKRGIGPEHVPAAVQALEDILRTPLNERGLQLASISAAAKRAEMEFSLPVGKEGAKLSPRRLARALGWVDAENGLSTGAATHNDPHPPGCLGMDYLSEVANLPFAAWSGFLRGFIDLVFEAEGRLYVVDYKSNYMGDTYGDYGANSLSQSMRDHHYLLQAVLYALAVHRHAGRRQADYDYETHFGGVYYLFVRGMRPSFGPSLGVVFLRPTAQEMTALSAVFADPLTPPTARPRADVPLIPRERK